MSQLLHQFLQSWMIRINAAIFFRQQRADLAHDLICCLAHRFLASLPLGDLNIQQLSSPAQ